jgi:hypothetical protein
MTYRPTIFVPGGSWVGAAATPDAPPLTSKVVLLGVAVTVYVPEVHFDQVAYHSGWGPCLTISHERDVPLSAGAGGAGSKPVLERLLLALCRHL